MITLSHKAKQYLLATLKVLILGITFAYIYLKLTDDETLPFSEFIDLVKERSETSLVFVLLSIGLATLNWTFEILKWKKVVSAIAKISFITSLKQSLASLTVSLATPNRIGDYGAKAYFYKAEKRRQILLLNFLSNGAQMAITAIFGMVGLIYIIVKHDLTISIINIALLAVVFMLLAILGYLFKEKELILRGLSLHKVGAYINKLSNSIKTWTFLYSLARYLVFSSLFFLLLKFFGAQLSFWEAAPIIYGMYLLVSLVPTVFIFDVVVRGGVAVWLFSLVGVSELTVLCVVLAMWILNFVIPAIVGSFYLIKHPTS